AKWDVARLTINFASRKFRPLDAKQSHPVIYSIFLISTSLNSQHLNGGNAKRVSFWIPCSPTRLSVTHKKNRPAKLLQLHNYWKFNARFALPRSRSIFSWRRVIAYINCSGRGG